MKDAPVVEEDVAKALQEWIRTPTVLNARRLSGGRLLIWLPADQMVALGHLGSFLELGIDGLPGMSTRDQGLGVCGILIPFWRPSGKQEAAKTERAKPAPQRKPAPRRKR